MQSTQTPLESRTGQQPDGGISEKRTIHWKSSDYGLLLDDLGVSYSIKPPYLHIGTVPLKGWVLHISVVTQQAEALLRKLLPEIKHTELASRIPIHADAHTLLVDGRGTPDLSGRVISIYTDSENQAIRIAGLLIAITENLEGPDIPNAFHLANRVYTTLELHTEQGLLTAPEQISEFTHHPYTKQERNLLAEWPWPFRSIVTQKTPQKRRIIKNHVLVAALKNDPKGNVYKCIQINWKISSMFLVLKQARRAHCYDDQGRDVKARLLWQYRVQKLLSDHLPVPKVFDFFDYRNDSFLSMEYIEGQTLSDLIVALYEGKSWKALTKKAKLDLCKYLLKIVLIVEKLHLLNYVHRDLNAQNFIIKTDGAVYLHDFELCYSLSRNEPSPPFALGTAGYMSPEQLAVSTPAFAEDIYALGGLMIKVFTGLSPIKFEHTDPAALRQQLKFFLGDHDLIDIIVACKNHTVSLRPPITDIRNKVGAFESKLNSSADNSLPAAYYKESPGLLEVIHTGLSFLIYHLMPELKQCPARDFAGGSGGILYLLALTARSGLRPKGMTAAVDDLFSDYQKEFLWGPDLTETGLFAGCSGSAVVLTELLKANLISDNQAGPDQLHECFLNIQAEDLSIANGLAGHGIAILKTLAFADPRMTAGLLQKISEELIKRQLPDGSWLIQSATDKEKSLKLPGFVWGISGIVHFLISYGFQCNNEAAKVSAKRALGWLAITRTEHKGHLLWSINPHLDLIDPWLEDGFTGIAYVFVNAYRYFREPYYKAVAVDALLSHPAQITTDYFGFAKGLSGLGEIYLEAFEVFEEQHWQDRADYIAAYFLHTGTKHPDGSRYWITDKKEKSDHSLFSGQSGILHFLLRYAFPDKIKFLMSTHK